MRLTQTVPAMPVGNITAAGAYYRDLLGFTIKYADGGFAAVQRDDAEVHLWQANDETWRHRADLSSRPVCSGAESFIAGTASCRIQVDDVDALYGEMAATGVLHYADRGSAVDTWWGTREFGVTDQDGNLLTFFRRR